MRAAGSSRMPEGYAIGPPSGLAGALRLDGKRREVAFDDLPVLLVRDGAEQLLRLRLPCRRTLEIAVRDERAGHALGRRGAVPGLDALAAQVEDLVRAPRVVERLGAMAEHAVHAGEHPVAARLVGRGADLAPVPGGRVGRVDEL